MNTTLKSSLIGFTGGAASVLAVSVFSGGAEIFDNTLGSYFLEAILSALAIFVGLRYVSLKSTISFLAFSYVGLNIGMYLIGSEEQRLYFQVGLFWSLFYFKYPAALGIVAYMVRVMLRQNKKETERDLT